MRFCQPSLELIGCPRELAFGDRTRDIRHFRTGDGHRLDVQEDLGIQLPRQLLRVSEGVEGAEGEVGGDQDAVDRPRRRGVSARSRANSSSTSSCRRFISTPRARAILSPPPRWGCTSNAIAGCWKSDRLAGAESHGREAAGVSFSVLHRAPVRRRTKDGHGSCRTRSLWASTTTIWRWVPPPSRPR
jgi:hypothetical protein